MPRVSFFNILPNKGNTPDRYAPGDFVVGAPSAAWRFLQGVSPCRAKPNQQPVSSVAQLKGSNWE